MSAMRHSTPDLITVRPAGSLVSALTQPARATAKAASSSSRSSWPKMREVPSRQHSTADGPLQGGGAVARYSKSRDEDLLPTLHDANSTPPAGITPASPESPPDLLAETQSAPVEEVESADRNPPTPEPAPEPPLRKCGAAAAQSVAGRRRLYVYCRGERHERGRDQPKVQKHHCGQVEAHSPIVAGDG
jgi:hypothetical protein